MICRINVLRRCSYGFRQYHTTSVSVDDSISTAEKALLELNHAQQPKALRSSRSIYHAILVQLNHFPDQNCAAHIKTMVRHRYHAHVQEINSQKISRLKVNAKKCLITLQKANLGDTKALSKVLAVAYGQRGKLRHEYLASVLSEVTRPSDEIIPGKPRSKLPVVGPQLQALWKLQFERKKLDLELPLGPGGEFGKPLDRRRQVNLTWRHHTNLIEKTNPPIPYIDLEVVSGFASGTRTIKIIRIPTWRRFTWLEMQARSPIDSHNLTTRLLRRSYRSLLMKIPVLYKSPEGAWRARYANLDEGSEVQSRISAFNDQDFELISKEKNG